MKRAPKGGCQVELPDGSVKVYRGGQFLPGRGKVLNPEPRTLNPPSQPLLDALAAQCELRGLADLPDDPEAAAAVWHFHRGCASEQDHRIMGGRLRRVRAMFRDGATSPVLREFWSARLAAPTLCAYPEI